MVDQVKIERFAKRRILGARLGAGVLLTIAMQEIGAIRAHVNGDFLVVSQLIWVTVIFLFLLFAGGGLVRTAAMRAALYDDSTIEHVRSALSMGFWGALLACGACWILSSITQLDGPEVARAVITYSVAMALMHFSNLEAKALRE